jgi:hypothetical protein
LECCWIDFASYGARLATEQETVGFTTASHCGINYFPSYHLNFIDFSNFSIWMNYIAAAFIACGVIFDAGVWRYVKDLKIFDDEVKNKEIEIADKEDEQQNEKKPLS